MKFRIISTHNPQDFFNGDEPFELSKVQEADTLDAIVEQELKDGYKVIVTIPDKDGGD